MILCWHANKEDECWPSIGRLADCTKLSENTIRVSVSRLVSLGIITARGRKDKDGDPATNLYTVIGYDPPRGGTANERVPVPQIGGYGTSNQTVEVPQSSTPNVVKEEQEAVNGARRTSGPAALEAAPPPQSANSSKPGNLTDLHGRPFDDSPPPCPHCRATIDSADRRVKLVHERACPSADGNARPTQVEHIG